MKMISSLFIISLFISGVFGDELTSVSVNVGDFLSLHTHIQAEDVIHWRFEGDQIAQIDSADHKISIYADVHDGMFRDRLQVDDQTGSLTITNITTQHSGLYQAVLSNSDKQSFRVTVNDGLMAMMSVMEGRSVTLYTDTENPPYDLIEWMFGDERAQLAEIYKPEKRFTAYDDVLDGRFRNRLRLNHQSGSLTVTSMKTEHAGVYEVKMSGDRYSLQRRFNVKVTALTLPLVSVVGICFILLILAAAGAAFVIYCHCQNDYKLIFSAQKMTVIKGDSVTLRNYLIKILRDDVIMWMREDEEIQNPTLYVDDQTGSLTIPNITTEDSGRYQMKIMKTQKLLDIIKSGKLLNIFKMRKDSCKRFDVIVVDKHIQVNVGETVSLETGVTEINTDEKIEWMYGDGDTIYTIAEINPAHNIFRTCGADWLENTLEVIDQTGDLTINDITHNHSGVYTLKTMKGGKESFMKFHVMVTDPPEKKDSAEVKVSLVNREFNVNLNIKLAENV